MKKTLFLFLHFLFALFLSDVSAIGPPEKLYGATFMGGNNNFGVLFSYSPSSDTYDKLLDFSGINGANPTGTLLQGQGSIIYGTTYSGGNSGDGVIFSYNTTTSVYTKVHDFNGNDGSSPLGGLVFGPGGKMYGVTTSGGGDGYGVLFSYDTTNGTFTKLHDFLYDNGGRPVGDVVLAPDNKLYGYVAFGDTYIGVMFSFDVTTNAFSPVHDFSDNIELNGDFPSGTPVLADDGKLYGLTSDGGPDGVGVLFSYDPVSAVYAKLFDFGEENGSRPGISLINGPGGKLYGTTNTGGVDNLGLIYSFDIYTASFERLFEFQGMQGAERYANFIFGSDGNLYGVSVELSDDLGEIFSFNISSHTYLKLHDFDGSNGISGITPGLLLELRDCTTEVTCPLTPPLCFNETGKYIIPVLKIKDNCGSPDISYFIKGATNRSGKGADASGKFNTGTSKINWTIKSAKGETSYCQTTVIIKRPLALDIPDVWTVKQGGSANTIYIGYGPTSLTLIAKVYNGEAPFTYKWSNGAETQSISVSPQSPGTYGYTLEITDAMGCKSTIIKQVDVVDARCGNKNNKVLLCKQGSWKYGKLKTICVSKNAVQAHLNKGYYLCSCANSGKAGGCDVEEEDDELSVTVSPNPASALFKLNIRGSGKPLRIRVTDVSGRVIEVRNNVVPNGPVRLGHNYRRGIYYAEVVQGSERVAVKLVKL